MNQKFHEIEILRPGTFTSANGITVKIGEKEIQDVVESYNPTNFAAPLIVKKMGDAHSVDGVPDKKVAATNFAYGAPKFLRRVGDRVRAVFDKVSPEFTSWVKNGNILSISPSLYQPFSPNNPTPGKFSLRHIAGLGADPPAIKGLTPPAETLALSEFPEWSFSEDEDALNINLSGTPEVLEFSNWKCQEIGRLFQGLREFLIDKHDLETADRFLPSWTVGMLMQPEPEEEMGLDYQEQPQETADMSEKEELEKLRAQIEQEKRDLALRQEQQLRRELASFCEHELKGRLTPAIAPVAEVVEFMVGLDSAETIDFSDSNKTNRLEWFKTFLKRIPSSVQFSELAAGDDPADFGEKKKAEDADSKAAAMYENAWKKGSEE